MVFSWISNKSPIKHSLEASVTRACAKCGAKGVDEKGKTYDVCPECGTARPPVEHLGVIWKSHYTMWEKLQRRFKWN
jgi:hypothetical protein